MGRLGKVCDGLFVGSSVLFFLQLVIYSTYGGHARRRLRACHPCLPFRNRNRRDSVMLERTRLALLIVFIFLLLTGCLSPDRAGQDRVTMRSRDRSMASRVTGPSDPQPIGENRVAVQTSPMPASSRAQSPDVIRAAPDDSWS